jgi:hypothetical protein
MKTYSLSPSTIGRSRLHDLTGPELSKFVKKELLLDEIWDNTPLHKLHTLTTLHKWMKILHDNLLHKQQWTQTQQTEFKSFTKEIISNWKTITNTKLTPKCHILAHIIPFVKQFKYLGKYNESSMESYHGQYRHIEQYNHKNTGKNIGKRLRRTLADFTLRSIQPFL